MAPTRRIRCEDGEVRIFGLSQEVPEKWCPFEVLAADPEFVGEDPLEEDEEFVGEDPLEEDEEFVGEDPLEEDEESEADLGEDPLEEDEEDLGPVALEERPVDPFIEVDGVDEDSDPADEDPEG